MVVLLTRLPFLENGFGLDFDAWMLAESARRLMEEGVYIPSRPPGYPLTELALAPLVGLGPLVTNGATALISVLCVVLLFDLLRKAEAPAALELSLAFSVTPVVWIASVTTIDYMWGLAFSLAGLRSALRDRPDAAGVWIGLAAAARAPSILALLPVLALSRRRVPCLLWSGLFVAAIYTTLLLIHGLEALTPQALARPGALFIARQATVGVLGELGAIAFSGALFFTLERRDAGTPLARAGLLLAAPHILLYLAAPYDAGYLIPALAGIFLWLGSRLPRGGGAALAACLALSSVTGLQHRAPILRDVDLRAAEMDLLEKVVEAVEAEQMPTALLCGQLFPKVRYALGGKEEVGPVSLHVAIPREARLRQLLEEGVQLRYVPGIEAWYARRTGQSLQNIARPLPDHLDFEDRGTRLKVIEFAVHVLEEAENHEYAESLGRFLESRHLQEEGASEEELFEAGRGMEMEDAIGTIRVAAEICSEMEEDEAAHWLAELADYYEHRDGSEGLDHEGHDDHHEHDGHD